MTRPTGVEQSDGAKPLPVIVYYARLAQRFIAALTAPTAAGGLYEVDMRLRPTGNKGPVAVSLKSFARYHSTRILDLGAPGAHARPRDRSRRGACAARSKQKSRAHADRRTRPTQKIVADARDMRDKLAAQFPGRNRWDLKFAPGGLVDIEFIAQTLQLRDAPRSAGRPRHQHDAALRACASRCDWVLSAKTAQSLIEAATLQHALTQVLRIALDGTLDPQTATPGLKALLVRAAGLEIFARSRSAWPNAGAVREIFERVLV